MRISVVAGLLISAGCTALTAESAAASAAPSPQIDASAETSLRPGQVDPAPATAVPASPGAQTESTTLAPPGAEREVAAPQAGTGLDDIVVTATRREESLQRVPIAVSAVSGDQLARTGITNTRDLTQTMPALDFSRSNLVQQPTVRGVGTQAVGVGDENSVAVYVDGVYQADPNAAQIDFVNIARVEVLRGPQGTLFGRNATGGLVNIITSPPSHERSGQFKVSFGSYNTLEASAYATTGLTTGVAFDISGFSHTDDGYIRDLVTGERIGKRHSYVVRPRFLIQPTSNLDITLAASYAHVDDPSAIIRSPFQGNASARALAVDPGVVLASAPRTAAQSQPQLAALNTYQGSADIKLDLGAVTLQNTTSYQNTRIYDFLIDQDATPFDFGYVTNDGYGTHYFQNEFRILSNSTGPLSLIAGAFYINGRGFNKALNVYFSAFAPPVTISSVQTVDSISGFGEATLRFGDGWKIVGGLRYTSEHRGYTGSTSGFGLVFSQVDTSDRFNKLTYRAILQKEFDRLGSVYASYSTGFKSGVYNSYNTAANSQAVRPELVKASEVGVKLDPLSWLRVNIAAFNYDYTDIQQSARDPVTQLVQLSNAAVARMRGGELEATARVATGLNLRAFATLLDAKFTRFPGAQVLNPIYEDQSAIGGSPRTPIGNQTVFLDEAGKRLIRAPITTFGGSFDYTKETSSGEFGATANVFHTAKYYWDVDNRLFQPAYTIVNGELSWIPAGTRIRLSVWAKNLTDEVIYGQLSSGERGDDVKYERPRTIGGAVVFKF